MADWAIVKGVCSRFDKQREWSDQGLRAAGATVGKRSGELTRQKWKRHEGGLRLAWS